MKCVISGLNVKIFGKAIHSLSKVGEELYIEPLSSGLTLRTVNSSRSAYGCFIFSTSFFIMFDVGQVLENSDDEEDTIKCKVHMKPCFNIFKSLSSLEKMVEKCKITVNYTASKLVFRLYCKHGIVKTYNLAFIECETLQAVFAKDRCPNVICAQSRLLNDSLLNFQTSQEEITLTVSLEAVSLKNYVDDEPDPTKILYTEMCLSPDEFDSFNISADCEITFCLKELRALLLFSDSINLPVTIYFETSGKPIIFSLDDSSFEAQFVLATLADSIPNNSGTPSTSQTSQVKKSVNRPINKPLGGRTKKTTNSKQINGLPANKKKDTSKKKINYNLEDEDFQVNRSKFRATEQVKAGPSGINTSSVKLHLDVPLSSSLSQGFPFVPSEQPAAENNNVEEECVPGTPPSKKFKSMFFGLSQSTIGSYQNLTQSAILAEDTDEDD